jgi:hypothetical protein
MAKDFTIYCDEPIFHEEPEPERRARTERVLAIIRHELPNILPEDSYAALKEELDAQADGFQAEAEHADDE